MIYAKTCGFKASNAASKQIEQVKRYSPRTRREPGAARSEARGCRLQYQSVEEGSQWGESSTERLILSVLTQKGIMYECSRNTCAETAPPSLPPLPLRTGGVVRGGQHLETWHPFCGWHYYLGGDGKDGRSYRAYVNTLMQFLKQGYLLGRLANGWRGVGAIKCVYHCWFHN